MKEITKTEELNEGDIVYHKATDQKMVVLVAVSGTIRCRYLGAKTGLYEVQEFRKPELYKK